MQSRQHRSFGVPGFTLLLFLLLAASILQARPLDVTPIDIETLQSDTAPRAGTRGSDLYLFGASGPGAFGQPGTNGSGYDFEGVEPAGWFPVPPPGTDPYWHIDTVSKVTGHNTDMTGALPFSGGDPENTYALWCGTDTDPLFLSSGYGNNWNVAVDVAIGLPVTTGSTIDFHLANQYEGVACDYFVVEVMGTAGTWVMIYYNDNGFPESGRDLSLPVTPGDVGGYLDKVRFRFISDPGWSDEDGSWPTDIGAVWLDNIVIQVDGTPVVTEDFEDGTMAAAFSLISLTGYDLTNYTILHDGVDIPDPCWDDTRSAWGFFDAGTTEPAYPGGVISYGPPWAWMVLESPALERDQLGGQLEYVYGSSPGIWLDMDCFMDLPPNAVVYFKLTVSARVEGGTFGDWKGNLTYYGSPLCQTPWSLNLEMLASQSSGPGVLTGLKVRIEVVDMCPVWCNMSGDGSGHTVGLLLDDVSIRIPGDGEPIDFSDSPDPTYPTLLASNGARHAIVAGYSLGTVVDGEADGLPSPLADGDDLNGVPDDEDGVIFTLPLVVGSPGQAQVTASAPGMLNAWFDFNADGDWADAGEQIFIDLPLVAGPNPIGFPIPIGATPGMTYARFRFNVVGGLSYTGFAEIGDVEDYYVELEPPPTGNIIIEKQTDIQGAPQSFEFSSSYGYNFTLIDDGTNDSGSLPIGAYTVTELATPGWTLTSITCNDGNSSGDVGTGVATILLEAYETVTCVFVNTEIPPELDWGDAPDPPYCTLAASNGASHVIVPGAPFLGLADPTDDPDWEPDGQPHPVALGDDLAGLDPDDEDGVVIPLLQAGQTAAIVFEVNIAPAFVDGWIDFNGNGIWGDVPNEYVVAGNYPPGLYTTGVNAPPVTVPAGAVPGQTFARFRINTVGPLTPCGGPAEDGEVEDHVLEIEPLTTGNVIFTPDPQTIVAADGPMFIKEIVCQYLGGGSGTVYGYSIDVLYDSNIITAVFGPPDNGPFSTTPLFIVTPIAGGVRIDAAVGGAGSGITSGELFKVTATGIGCGSSPLALTLNNFRDNANQPLSGFTDDDGEVQVDIAAPAVTNEVLVRTNMVDNGYVKDGDDLKITADFADACGGFAGLTITADLSDLLLGGGTAVAPTGTADPTVTWTLTSVALTADGTKTVTLKAVDAMGNEVTTTVSIIVDNTMPAAVSDITADPHHLEVEVGWTHNGIDVNRYWIYRGMWYDTTPGTTAYPEYDDLAGDVIPTRPGAGALPDPVLGWLRVDADDLGSTIGTFFDLFVDYDPADPPRGVYYYEVFAVDAAGNWSDPATANDRATNYWLGDVSDQGSGTYGVFDGLVSGADITQLGTYYGTSPVVVAGKPIDVGPTDDYSRVGIPTTDDRVGFEDLMIFSMNYGIVVPLPLFQEGATLEAQIAWRQVGESVWSLVLEEPCLDLKGLNISSRMIAGSVISVQPGALCGQQAGQIFLRNIDTNGLDAGLALLGTDLGFIGSGELMRVTFAHGVTPDDVNLTLRNSLNAPVGVEMEMTGAADDLPAAYMMTQNFPNPFNPKTSISFDLPEAQNVRLSVFAPDGRCIITLVNEAVSAGHHSVTWNGRDSAGQPVASGLYFYSIEAGPLQKTSKMLLLK
ncbi:MAG: hypothetical protein GY835_10370 [bacterium]|nr:hypothetical protein [bacterium]